MSVKQLLIDAPRLCGAAYHAKHARIAELVWQDEVTDGAFQRVSGESAHDRIAFLFDWRCDDYGKREYIKRLVELTELAHYGAEHADALAKKSAEVLSVELLAQESAYPDVAATLSVAEASRGWWGD